MDKKITKTMKNSIFEN